MKTRRKAKAKCTECGSTDEVIDGLCDSCESERVYCNICKVWHSREGEECRHLFWTEDGYGGSGATETEPSEWKESFFRLLDRIAAVKDWDWQGRGDKTLVDALEVEIGRNAFWTFFHGFMFSRPDIDFVCLRPDLPCGDLAFATLRAETTEPWEGTGVDDGFNWLQSLQADSTPEANALTVEWIREWRRVPASREGEQL